MPEPQIVRRCRSCGVSVRVPASSCPECGNALTQKSDGANEAEDTELTLGPETSDLIETSTAAETKALNFEQTITQPTAVSTSPSARKHPMQATIGMVHRTEPQPREVIEEDGLNRAQKFRQISSAMIDEAAYDPSLRFVLVAAVLFVVFVVLLLMSELIT